MPGKMLHCFRAVSTAILLLLFTAGCSDNGGQEQQEKGTVEKMTDQAAETAVKKIRRPQDKARATQNLGNDRLEEMDKALQKQ